MLSAAESGQNHPSAAVAIPSLATAADGGLPETTAAELLATMAQTEPTPLSGTAIYIARADCPTSPRSSPAAPTRVLPRIGARVERPAFHPHLTGRADLERLDAVDATVDPHTAPSRIAAAPDRVGLTAAAGKGYRTYSLGMKQRLGLAAALLRPRDLLVLVLVEVALLTGGVLFGFGTLTLVSGQSVSTGAVLARGGRTGRVGRHRRAVAWARFPSADVTS